MILRFLRVEECWKEFCKTHEMSDPSCAKVLWVLLFTSHGEHLHRKSVGFAKKKHCTSPLSVKSFQLSSSVVLVYIIVVAFRIHCWNVDTVLRFVNLEHLYSRVGCEKKLAKLPLFFFPVVQQICNHNDRSSLPCRIRVLQIWVHLLVRREPEKTSFACR